MINNERDFEDIIKLIIIGNEGVGKSNFLYRFVEGEFCPVHKITVGFDFKSKICYIPKLKKKVKFQIWDTAGTEKYLSININLFQRVQGIILMYDIGDKKSFDDLEKWMEIVKELGNGIPLILIGNKIDRDLKNERKISKEKGEEFASNNNITFFESSGKSGINVEESFICLGEKIIKNNFSYGKGEKRYIISKDKTCNNNIKKKKCC